MRISSGTVSATGSLLIAPKERVGNTASARRTVLQRGRLAVFRIEVPHSIRNGLVVVEALLTNSKFINGTRPCDSSPKRTPP